MPFPPSIDLCRSGYSRNLKGEQTPQTFDAWQRQRRKVRQRGVTDTVCWIVTKEQCGELEQFHRQASGNYFEIELPTYNGIFKTAVRFDGPLTINPVRDHYEITASLYVPQPPIMPDDELSFERRHRHHRRHLRRPATRLYTHRMALTVGLTP